jgi:DNA-binding transcriptional MerR regulator
LLSRHRGWESEAPLVDNVVPFRARRRSLIEDVAARRDDDAPAGGAGGSRSGSVLREEDVRAIETTYPEGLTAVQIVDAFTSRGINLSEASFRKYVQLGLLPRSRRIGRKGKHKGSLGVYPAKTLRRINAVKQWMADGYTIEQIQTQFLVYDDLVENVGEHIHALLARLLADAHAETADPKLKKELAELKRTAHVLLDQLTDVTRRMAAPRTDTLRLAGAAGGAEDLL